MRLVQEDVSQALTDAAKNWVAMDGLWFQAVEQAYGMDAALAMDRGSGSSLPSLRPGG